jgi:hypothetical protein
MAVFMSGLSERDLVIEIGTGVANDLTVGSTLDHVPGGIQGRLHGEQPIVWVSLVFKPGCAVLREPGDDDRSEMQ